MTRLLLALIVLLPSAALAQYNYGGGIQHRPYGTAPNRTPTYTPQAPTYQPRIPNGPTVIRQGGQPKLCSSYGGVTTCP
jgi:hypothetical protein